MKVLLVNPSQFNSYGFRMVPIYPPLGLLYIASIFEKENCKVHFIDMDADRLNAKGFSDLLNGFNPDIVGITSSTPTYNNALSIAKIAKNTLRDIKIILGGVHPTIAPTEVIQNDYVDFVIEGEGEIAVRQLIAQLNSFLSDYTKVPGLWYKLNGKIFNNPRAPLITDLDSIDFPDRHLINNPQRYLGQDVLRIPIASIITSRGCPGRCTFCQTKQILGMVFRYRSIDNIIAELDILVNKFKVKEIHIMDDVFTLFKEHVLRLCDKIRSRRYNIIFQMPNGVKADMVDEDILRALKSIGFINIGFGVETGNELIMKKIKKDGVTKDKFRNAYRLAKQFGFETWGFFIIGLPDETITTIRETIDFAKELDPDFAKFLIFKPLLGSEAFEELKNKGLIFDNNYSNYGLYTAPVHRLENIDENEILYWQKRAFKEFYFRPKKLLNLLFRKWTFVRLKRTIYNLNFIIRRSF